MFLYQVTSVWNFDFESINRSVTVHSLAMILYNFPCFHLHPDFLYGNEVKLFIKAVILLVISYQ